MKIDIEDYYIRYGSGVFRRCMSLLQDEDRAYDALQEVFVKLIEKKEKLYDKYPSTLLYRMATNICINMIRDEKKNINIDNNLLIELASKDSVESRFVAQDLLDRIFHKEKESTKTIAVMYFLDKLTYKEISSELGMSVSGIRKRLRNLKEKLKCQNEDHYEW